MQLTNNLYKNGSNRILVTKDNTFSHVSCLEWGLDFTNRKTTRSKLELKDLELITKIN